MQDNYILLILNFLLLCFNIVEEKKTIFEITGGITIDNITKYSKLNVEFISTSKITNSSYSVDIGLDII